MYKFNWVDFQDICYVKINTSIQQVLYIYKQQHPLNIERDLDAATCYKPLYIAISVNSRACVIHMTMQIVS